MHDQPVNDKAPNAAITTALEAMKAAGMSPSVNVKSFLKAKKKQVRRICLT